MTPETPNVVGPHNLEAEQALLGAVLFENEAYHRIPAMRPDMFGEPFHGRMWAAMEDAISKNLLYKLAEGATAAQGFVDFSTVLRGAVEMAEAAHGRGGQLVGVATGLTSLDRKLGGLHRSDLLILAGRPSMGKTALATNIAYNAARKGHVIGFFSLEMSAEQLGLRILADRVGISGDRIRRGDTDAREMAAIRDAAAEIERLPLHTDATGALGIAQLAARARRMKRLHGLDLIVVDYLQLVTTKSKPGANRVGEVTEITSGLKALAKDLNVPVLALSQLSRAV